MYGAREIVVEATPGSTIYVDIGPRASHLLAAMVGSVAGVSVVPNVYGSVGEAVAGVTVGASAGSTAGAAVATAAEGQGKPCGGPSWLALIAEESALLRLQGLYWSW